MTDLILAAQNSQISWSLSLILSLCQSDIVDFCWFGINFMQFQVKITQWLLDGFWILVAQNEALDEICSFLASESIPREGETWKVVRPIWNYNFQQAEKHTKKLTFEEALTSDFAIIYRDYFCQKSYKNSESKKS